MKHTLVALDSCYFDLPSFAIDVEITKYHQTTTEEDLISRMRDATIVITDSKIISAHVLAQCPKLQFLCLSCVGTDRIALEECKARGIRVSNTPNATVVSVAEHAIALYFSVKRNVVQMHAWVKEGEWTRHAKMAHSCMGRKSRPCSEEVLGIVGHGKIGQQIATFAKALGMKVLISERKGKSTQDVRPGRVSFQDVLKYSTVLVLVCPLDGTTQGMISAQELSMMQQDSILINVGRGGLVNEPDLVNALHNGIIGGAATDVFQVEPASTASSPYLSDVPNLTLSPHVGWYNAASFENIRKTLKENVEAFVAGNPINIVV